MTWPLRVVVLAYSARRAGMRWAERTGAHWLLAPASGACPAIESGAPPALTPPLPVAPAALPLPAEGRLLVRSSPQLLSASPATPSRVKTRRRVREELAGLN